MRRSPLTLMILDIDHFKRVNDTYGHDCGDEVLKGFADRLRGIIRGGDLLCRLGGEEFVIVMPGVNVAAAARIAERARQAVEQEPFVMPDSRQTIADHRLHRPRRAPRRHQPARTLPPRRPGAVSLEVRGAQQGDGGRGLSLRAPGAIAPPDTRTACRKRGAGPSAASGRPCWGSTGTASRSDAGPLRDPRGREPRRALLAHKLSRRRARLTSSPATSTSARPRRRADAARDRASPGPRQCL